MFNSIVAESIFLSSFGYPLPLYDALYCLFKPASSEGRLRQIGHGRP